MNQTDEVKGLIELMDLNALAVCSMKEERNAAGALLKLFEAKQRLDSWFTSRENCSQATPIPPTSILGSSGVTHVFWRHEEEEVEVTFGVKSFDLGLYHGGFNTSTAVENVAPSNCFKMFNKAFLFEDSLATNKTPVEMLATMAHLTAVILYNTALISHRTALCMGREWDFAISQYLYEQAFRTLETAAHLRIYSSNFNPVLLAIFNNLGFIHSFYGNRQRATFFREQMYLFFVYTDCQLKKDEYVFYYITLLLTHADWPMFAPAA